MRRALIALAVAGLLASGGTAYAVTAGSSSAPECTFVQLVNPDGSVIWTEGCGTGSNGETPFARVPSGTKLTVDGSVITTDGCGATRATACVLLWGASPRS